VLKISRAQIDMAYITRWAETLGLGDFSTAIQLRINRGT